jgi:hypothetical protein
VLPNSISFSAYGLARAKKMPRWEWQRVISGQR